MKTREKTGGREKGTPNKLTKELRETLKSVVDNELENLNELLNQLEPKDRLSIICKILPFVVPKATEDPNQAKQFEPIEIIFVDSKGRRRENH